MNYLLDTHFYIWYVEGDKNLSKYSFSVQEVSQLYQKIKSSTNMELIEFSNITNSLNNKYS